MCLCAVTGAARDDLTASGGVSALLDTVCDCRIALICDSRLCGYLVEQIYALVYQP